MLHLATIAATWSPPLRSSALRAPAVSCTTRLPRAQVVADLSLADRADELYRTLLVDGPIEIVYGPDYVDVMGDRVIRPVVGLRVTPAGYFGLSIAALWTAYAPAGLVAYIRDARARGEDVRFDWLPEYIWPQRAPEIKADAEPPLKIDEDAAKCGVSELDS
jgi:hypothetical protein